MAGANFDAPASGGFDHGHFDKLGGAPGKTKEDLKVVWIDGKPYHKGASGAMVPAQAKLEMANWDAPLDELGAPTKAKVFKAVNNLLIHMITKGLKNGD